MIRAQRESKIIELVEESGVASIRELALRLGRVSEVSVRRDVVRLAEEGRLARTRGGAQRLTLTAETPSDTSSTERAPSRGIVETVDALVLPPISGAGAGMLRLRARQRQIPFIAESSPQDGGTYLGPDNYQAGYDLGRAAGEDLNAVTNHARILLVSLDVLPNTRMRCDGFLKGFGETFSGNLDSWRVEGEGTYRIALRGSMDALTAHGDINVLFGVNDHSILAAIEAADQLSLDEVSAYAVGGEGGALWDMLARAGKLKAVAALFPEVVGARAVDSLAKALSTAELGLHLPSTPHRMLTAASLPLFYRKDRSGWHLADEGRALVGPMSRASGIEGRTVGFMPHYPAHDWYRNMGRAMRERATHYGLDLVIAAPGEDIAREIRTRRSEIARAAARQVEEGESLLLTAGEACELLAEELKDRRGLTVVTNSFAVLEILTDRPGLKVILTGGEYHAARRCLVGPSLGALFETMRIDRAFVAVEGISLRFGLSAADERMALAAWRCIQAARSVSILADHSLVGHDANHRIAPLGAVSTLITDSGSMPADRLAIAGAGIRVVLAGED